MTTLIINTTQQTYPIYIGQGIINAPQYLLPHIHGKQVMIVSHQTLVPLYVKKLQSHFNSLHCNTLLLPEGEQHKNLATATQLFDALIQQHHHRDTTLIALGGGIITDITGFVAACYQRGVNFIQIPTTLLAQIDASIGGKTGVNHPLGKNLIGAFHQPQCIVIDVQTLTTLPKREFRSGCNQYVFNTR